MKTILRTITTHFLSTPEKRNERKMLKMGDKLYKRIITRMNPNEAFPHPPYRRKNLLRRRLKQYQQLRRHGSNHAKAAAIRKLEKEWRKFQRDGVRKFRIKNK